MLPQLLALGAGLMLLSGVALAEGGDIQITDAWARATPSGAQTAVTYVTVESPVGDRLTGVSTPAAQKADIHEMTMDGNVMKMRQVDDVDLPAGQTVTLKPGGSHIMLTGLAKPLKEGETFPLTLDFAKAGTRHVDVSVEKVGAMGPSGSNGGMTMPMHH